MSSPEELYARALDLLQRGDTAGAITDLKVYLEDEPEDESAWLTLGTAYAAVDHWPQAANALAEAVALDGNVADARLAYARALIRLGKLDDAAFQLIQGTKIAPDDGRLAKELGIVFYQKRLYDKAVRWLEQACQALPSDARAAYALGLTHEARKDYAASIAAYRRALQRDPSFSDARLTLADTLASMGEHEQAIAELEALLEVDRSHQQAAHNRDVLQRALEEMRAQRLLGKPEQDLQKSALIMEAKFKRREAKNVTDQNVLKGLVRYTAPLIELHVVLDGKGVIEAMHLGLTDPNRAARSEDDVFKVTVVAKDGRQEPVDYGTAVSLTFLREAMGCPMTQATELYTSLIQGKAEVEWAGATAKFALLPWDEDSKEEKHGILIRRQASNVSDQDQASSGFHQ